MTTKSISEVFDEVSIRETDSDKIAVLRCNTSYALKSVLKAAFHPHIRFCFEQLPEYKKQNTPNGLGYTTIAKEIDRGYIFEINNPKVSPHLSIDRKKEILIQILESLDSNEANVYAGMLMKNLGVKGLTYDLVKEAFPDILA